MKRSVSEGDLPGKLLRLREQCGVMNFSTRGIPGLTVARDCETGTCAPQTPRNFIPSDSLPRATGYGRRTSTACPTASPYFKTRRPRDPNASPVLPAIDSRARTLSNDVWEGIRLSGAPPLSNFVRDKSSFYESRAPSHGALFPEHSLWALPRGRDLR